MTANPVGTRGSLGSGNPIETVPGKRGPAQAFRLRLWAKRKKTAANEPGHFKDVRVARREALPHFRKEMRILNRRRQRPLARHPLVSGGEKKTGLPGASTKNTGDGARLDVSPGQAGGGMVDHGPIDCECSI
jgi:hypothetical protein